MSIPLVENRHFRRTLLSLHSLAPPLPDDPLPPLSPGGAQRTRDTVRRLGFVQVDSVAAVERAHHHILFTRHGRYRKTQLKQLLEQDRSVFENWTRDAAILPSELFPHWRHYFERFRRYEIHGGYRRYFAPLSQQDLKITLQRVRQSGPLQPRDLVSRTVQWADPYFAKPSLAKLAMERLWRIGQLAVTRRDGQAKVYDLTERVIPRQHLSTRISRAEHVDWVCRQTLARLGAATPSQIAQFYDAVSSADALRWCQQAKHDVRQVRIQAAGGGEVGPWFALQAVAEQFAAAPPAPRRLRLINPFDPLIHDRARTMRLFGFDYRIEIWVPPKKRKYGYYVFPVLHGDQFVGRIDARADRKAQRLDVLGIWWEPGLQPTKTMRDLLDQQLRQLAAFAGVDGVNYQAGQRRG